MIKERMIGCIPVEVDTEQANEIFLLEDHAAYVTKDGIGGIIDALYRLNGQEHMPLSVFFELTGFCNFSCPFCYINEAGYQKNRLPSWDELKPTIDYLIDHGMLHCLLSGGECLTHPDFAQIYRYLKQEGVLVTVFTNGYLLNDDLLRLFQEYKPFKVEISLYGADDESYRLATATPHVRAKTVFDAVLRLKEADILVMCKTPITKLTEDSYDDLVRWCDEHDISYYTGTELMDSYNGTDRKVFSASESIVARFREQSDKAFFEDPEMMELIDSPPKHRVNFDCTAGKTEVMIDSSYRLLPCMKAAWIKEWQFDIAKDGIDSAYNTYLNKLKQVKGTALQYCVGCSYHEVCQECFMTQYAHEDLETHRREYCRSLRTFIKNGPKS